MQKRRSLSFPPVSYKECLRAMHLPIPGNTSSEEKVNSQSGGWDVREGIYNLGFWVFNEIVNSLNTQSKTLQLT